MIRLPTLAFALLGLFAGPPARRAWADEVIEDPELGGEPLAEPSPPPAQVPAGRQGSLSIVGSTRLAVDTDWDEDNGEDVSEWRTRLDLEIGQPLGERARAFAAGRLEHALRARPEEMVLHARGAFEARLLDAYLDARVGPLDVRAGNQFIGWGRVDTLSAGDFWNPPDLREGFGGGVESLPVVPVPALRVEGRTGGVGLQAAWQPFFVPMRADVFGTDTALLGPGAPAGFRGLFDRVRPLIDDSIVDHVQDQLLVSELPEENLSSGQVGTRATVTLGESEIAASAFLGYEKIPTVWMSPELRSALDSPEDPTAWLPVVEALQTGKDVLRSRYERYVQLVLDGETPAGGFLVKWEVGYTPERTVYVRDDAECRIPCAARRGLVQGAAHLEKVEDDWQAQVEVFAVAATDGPGQTEGAELVFLGPGRSAVGASALVRWSPQSGDLGLEASTLTIAPGLSAAVSARAWLRLTDALRLEGGAVVAEAPSDGALANLDPSDLVWVGLRARY
ncbi:MAG: hypothetical protein HYY06_25890 [Deltaproteobacteria bacterium]|nr:hypothetical protein [Deltaproteobacteria bacterium]